MSLRIDRIEQDGAIALIVQGEVDLYSSPNLRTAIAKAMQKGAGEVAVDLREVAYMDSSGVATLVEGLRAAHRARRGFVLVAPGASVLKVLQLSRLDSVFTIRMPE